MTIQTGYLKTKNGTQLFTTVPYPVGAIYLSVDSTNPGKLFGGTWERIAQGRTLIGEGYSLDSSNTNDFWGELGASENFNAHWQAGSTGGELRHTLTIDELPSHNHNAYFYGYSTWGTMDVSGYVTDWNKMLNLSGATTSMSLVKSSPQLVQNTGNNQPHHNIQPYLVVYMWKRIS